MRRRNRNFALKLIPIHMNMRLSNYVLSKSTFFASKIFLQIYNIHISLSNLNLELR